MVIKRHIKLIESISTIVFFLRLKTLLDNSVMAFLKTDTAERSTFS